MRFLGTRYGRTCVGLVVVLALIVSLNDLGHFNTDIKPEVYLAPWDMVGRYLSSWTSSPYLGSANFNVGLVPVLLVLSALRAIGFSPEWTFKVFHFVLWLSAAWGANRLTRAALPRASAWVGLAAGVAYLANPYAIAAGNTLAIALPMALLPWMLLCYLRALQWRTGWGWPAAFGLTFFAMSGMNVAVIPLFQLLGLIPIAVVAVQRHERTWADVVRVTAKCAAFVIGVSIYWLIPGITALTLGSQVIDTSETLTGIHKVSSLTEVLRGLGLWPLYGHSDTGPWVPQNAFYLTSTPVVLLTALWPTLALLALTRVPRRVRAVLAVTIGIVSAVMVGLFPGEGRAESPLGWLLQGLFSIPAFAAFRTTNKVGALLALSFAIALAVALPSLVAWVRRRPGAPPVAAGAAMLVVGAWVMPALTNGLYISRMDIPGYWQEAARASDQGNPNSAVLMLPGQTRPSYRWSVQRPDDLANSLLKRDAIIPETAPNASAAGGNFLAALDDALQEGTSSGPVISTYARYLGADNILLRHDVVWEGDGGARPDQTNGLLTQDRGLYGVANFGRPGQNVLSPTQGPSSYNELLLHPVQLYGVKDPKTAVRAESAQQGVIVAGDGWSFAQMTDSGLLKNSPMVRYAQDLNAQELKAALASHSTLVITDTNARRNSIPQRLTAGEGALLASDEPVTSARTLGANPADQSVLLRSGTLVKATAAGATFFDLPYAVAENAFDGNPSTSWRFGDFRRAAGNTITFDMPAAQTLGDIPISQPDLGPVKIDKVTLSAGGKSVQVSLPDGGNGVAHLGGVRASKVSLHIDSIRGDGFNLVGISEVGLPGPKATRMTRTPQTLTNLYTQLDAGARREFAAAPVDVLLTRVKNTVSPGDDSEVALRRVVSIPVTKTMDATARVRFDAESLETAYDRVAGYAGGVVANSSGFYFAQPNWRASMAMDRSDTSGWMPSAPYRGAWWQVRGPKRAIGSVVVTQAPAAGDTTDGDKTQWATRVRVELDGKAVTTAPLRRNGTTTIELPRSIEASRVRLVITDTSGPADAAPAKFTTINTGWGLSMSEPNRVDADGQPRCLPVATVDGSPLYMRPKKADALAGRGDLGTEWTSCTTTVLSAGDHRVEQADGFILDNLNMRDARAERSSAEQVPPRFTVLKNTPTKKEIRVGRTAGQVGVLVGQSYDPRWRASLNGKDLGPATTVDGFSTGWLLPSAAGGVVTMYFAPQRYANVALVVTLLVLAIAAYLVWTLARRGRLRAPRPVIRGVGGSVRVTPERGHPPRGAHARVELATASSDSLRRAVFSRPTWAAQDWRFDLSLIGLATLGVGIGGLAGALIAVVARRRGVAMKHLAVAGAVVVFLAVGLYVMLNNSAGTVDADAISAHMTPHRLAAAGLVVALAAAVCRHDGRPGSRASVPSQAHSDEKAETSHDAV